MTKSVPAPSRFRSPLRSEGRGSKPPLRRLGRTERPPRPAPGRPAFPPAEGLS